MSARPSRTRSSQQPPAPTHTNSSSSVSSNTTVKTEKNVRQTTSNPINSPSPAPARRSESVHDPDSMSRAEQVAPRRSRRGVEVEKESTTKSQPEEEEAEVIEEEVTRCICGQAEYPGPGASVREQHPPNVPLSEDIGNFFVQCDNCHVWQHGGCMGFIDESTLPDEYYCEQCKPEFHKIIRIANSHKTSRYFPTVGTSDRSTPLSSVDPGRGKDSKGRSLSSTKRRATMNSRGAYDEDEALRRAIEESKAEGSLGKRTREDSEDSRRLMVKRQRTGSSASTTSSKRSNSPETPDDPLNRASNKHSSKLRGAAARNNREKELREKQKQETAALRAEAASKRNARSERRRGEDSPPPTPTLSPPKLAQSMAVGQKGKAETPPAGKHAVNRKIAGRTAPRGRRVGRNQYTRDGGDGDATPHRDASHDGNGENGRSPHGINGVNGESGRSSKARTHPARTSLNEMKKRVAAILEFVGQMQTQQARKINGSNGSNSNSSSTKGSSTPNGTSSATGGPVLPTSSLVQAVAAGLEEMGKMENGADGTKVKFIDEADFGRLGSQEMMETLTKELVQWQTAYGIYSR